MPSNTWWLDTGATIHVINVLQEVKNRRKPSDLEKNVHIFVCNGARLKVEYFGDIKLHLVTGHILELKDVAYVSSIRRNLISISFLDKCGFCFSFSLGKVNLMLNSILFGFGTLNTVYTKLICLTYLSLLLFLLLMPLLNKNVVDWMKDHRCYGIYI